MKKKRVRGSSSKVWSGGVNEEISDNRQAKTEMKMARRGDWSRVYITGYGSEFGKRECREGIGGKG